MSNHLVITRFGLLASDWTSQSAPPRLSNGELVSAFQQQARLFAESLQLPEKELQRIELVGVPREGAEDVEGNEEQDSFETLIALLPRTEWKTSIDGVDWVISRKASITSCSLQSLPGRSKIWLSIEGIPLSGQHKGRDQANTFAFLKLVNEHEEAQLNFLKSAYIHSLRAISIENSSTLQFDAPIKITLTDDETRPVASLVDAVYFDGLEPTRLRDIGNEDLRNGLDRLEQFITHAAWSDLKSDNRNLTVESSAPDIKGIVCKCEDSLRYASFVAGFARRTGDGGGYREVLDELDKDIPLSLDHVRARSAARHLSARLADAEVRKLDRRLKELRL
jgi:hypothetical protein